MNAEADEDGELDGNIVHLLTFLNRLDDARIFYALGRHRRESIMVRVDMPDLRWEVEFMNDGEIEIERFRSVAGVETDASILEELFRDL